MRTLPKTGLLLAAGALFLFSGLPLYGHIADEIGVKTVIVLDREEISLSFDIYSGVLFSTSFLKILDPDKNKIFEEAHIRDFSDFFLESLKLKVNGEIKKPDFAAFSASEWDYFAAGVSTIVLEYRLSGALPDETAELGYDFSFYPNTAAYSLHIKNKAPEDLAILKESRNEWLQDRVELSYTQDPRLVAARNEELAATAAAREKAAASAPERSAAGSRDTEDSKNFGDFIRNSFERLGILNFIRGKAADGGIWAFLGSSREAALVLALVLAAAAGFLHAFTPGHGKALVGAFLIANQGKAVHALLLGIVITAAHTVSIYGFGLLASLAARLFLPGDFIPFLTGGCGLFIMLLGLWTFFRRLLGIELDHAHLLPNLQILKKETVNILIDGQAAEAHEALLIAQDDEIFRTSLKAAGAEDFNFCSPGCAAHGRMPRAIRERQHAEFFKIAVKTGAVDAVVTRSDKTIRYMGKTRDKTWVERCDALKPRELLFRALGNFSSRGEITMPKEGFSWGRVISLGISGGIVPCPDALAVLLVAIAAGKTALGMGIILFFSLGLAFALILVGMIIVFTKGLLARQGKLGFAARCVPYISSLVITLLGLLMFRGSLRI
jgi:ABC-type nickel/cobalt efflux system permease component RcnA